MIINLKPFDFLDFGCSNGGSIEYAKKELGGRKGLGLDIDSKKVSKARRLGYSAKISDLTNTDQKYNGTVKFTIMAHFLEHLPGQKYANSCMRLACNLSDEFVFIRQPYFDADGYLFSLGYKLYWSDWSGHTFHMTSLDLFSILQKLQINNRISRFFIFHKDRIKHSFSKTIHPLDTSFNQHEYEGKLLTKKLKLFTYPVYRETGAIILTRTEKINNHLKKFLKTCVITYDSKYLKVY